MYQFDDQLQFLKINVRQDAVVEVKNIFLVGLFSRAQNIGHFILDMLIIRIQKAIIKISLNSLFGFI